MENDIACSGCVAQGGAEKNAARLAVYPCHFDNVAQSGRCSYTWMTDERVCRCHSASLLKVDGQYGSNINVQVHPKETGILKLSFSPRGGKGILVFSHRGIIHTTKLLPAKKTYEVLSVYVEKNKAETFTFIPLGGLNYPIRLDFQLKNYFTDNMA